MRLLRQIIHQARVQLNSSLQALNDRLLLHLELPDFILMALSHMGAVHSLHLTTIPHLNELVLEILHLISFCLLFFPIE